MNENANDIPVLYINSLSRIAADALAEIIAQNSDYSSVTDGRMRHDYSICLGIPQKEEDKTASLVISKAAHPAAILRQITAMIQNRSRNIVDLCDATLDIKARTLTKSSQAIRLTEKECAVLVYLKDNAPAAVSREDLLRDVWGYAEGIDTHTIETHIYRLRQKIENDPAHAKILVTDKEGGYMLGGVS